MIKEFICENGALFISISGALFSALSFWIGFAIFYYKEKANLLERELHKNIKEH